MSRAIIDSDSYMYKAACICGELVDLGEGRYYECYNINKAYNYLVEIFTNLSVTVTNMYW